MKTLLRCFILLFCGCSLQAQLVPNPSFEEGSKNQAEAWKLSAQTGGVSETDAFAGKRAIYVIGTGNDSNAWLSEPINLKPGQPYRISFMARGIKATNGTAVTGPTSCNVDIGVPKDTWTAYSNVFAAPSVIEGDAARLRFGQWHVKGRLEFDHIRVSPVNPIYHEEQGMELGHGEKITVNEYVYKHSSGSEGRNHSRPLFYNKANLNTNRWVFGQGSQIIFRHNVNGRQQLSASLTINMSYHIGGKLLVEASKDNKQWTGIGSLAKTGVLNAKLPPELLPADEVYVRLTADSTQKVGAKDSDPGSFQVSGYEYRSSLSGSPAEITGSTQYVEILTEDKNMSVKINSLGDALPGGSNTLSLTVHNHGNTPATLKPALSLIRKDKQPMLFTSPEIHMAPGETKPVHIKYEVTDIGFWEMTAQLGNDSKYSLSYNFYVPDFFDTTYGELIAAPDANAAVWWASSGWKVPQKRILPKKKAAALSISTARNEAEAAQLIICPQREMQGVTLSSSPLTGPGNAIIPAQNVELLRVHYSEIQIKTDMTSILGFWPDALPPVKPNLTLMKGCNQPFWVRVTAPKDAKAGLYKGAITIRDNSGWKTSVPINVTVFDFTLPDKMTCETAFGLSSGLIWKYHNIQDNQQKRIVWKKYLDTMSKHHISPYNPAQLDPWNVSLDTPRPTFKGGIIDSVTFASAPSSMLVEDDKDNRNISASYPNTFHIPKDGLTVSFKYKTGKPDHDFVLSFTHEDSAGKWMPGRNNDIRIKGKETWQDFSQIVNKFPNGAVKYNINIWAAPWTDKGEKLGKVWIDDFKLTDNSTGKAIIETSFEPVKLEELKLKFQWDAWDAAMSEAFDKYNFSCFRMGISGLGGGTFFSRYEPTFMNYKEGTPEYDHLFGSYMREIESHLKQKGWLDKAYVYWFDEPDEKDYDFVMNGFRKLKKYAPGLRRMLTEQIEDPLIGGPNLWCPVTPNLRKEQVPPRKAAGEQFWWYVCTGPKAPYATLFIDHPGTEMRVWLWQTWDYGVQGILVWQSNFWTSNSAYPDTLQNPYLDPMGWVSGYNTQKGTKRPWGNGDGRFIYPPEDAADGTQKYPVLDGPVDSIRLEMLRDGIEDFEYFTILKNLIIAKSQKISAEQKTELEKLLIVPADVSESMTQFTTNPATYETHRLKLAHAIAKLTNLK